MPIVCPDPTVLSTWRNAMAVSGGALLLATLLLVSLLARVRLAGWVPWLICGLSLTVATATGVAALVLCFRLNGAFAEVARWFPDYPAGCTPGAAHGPLQYISNIMAFAQQATAPLEDAARLDLVIAVGAAIALVACALIWGRARR